jgi:peroxiredoxin Q/BCP
MEGHQRNLYLYARFNARVAGVSRDDATTLTYWAEKFGFTFPILSNVTGYLATSLDVQQEGPVFTRLTLIIDQQGEIRYARAGSPDYEEILLALKRIHEEGRRP